MTQKRIRLVFTSRLLWLDLAQGVAEDLGASLGQTEDDRFAVAMALREALNNAIVHGNGEDSAKRVELDFLVRPAELELRVRDEGAGFSESLLPDPVAPQNLLRPRGRGVFLMRSYMDEVDLSHASRPGGEVRMIKRLATLDSGAGGPSGRVEANEAEA